MLTKPTDINCRQPLSRELYLVDPWLQKYLTEVAISNIFSLFLFTILFLNLGDTFGSLMKAVWTSVHL